MSHDVYANIVPFIVRDAAENADEDELWVYEDPGAHFCDEYDWDGDTKNMVGIPPLTKNSWTLNLPDLTELGEDGDIFGVCWRKGEKVVWLVNESHYSNGGDYNMSVVANNRDSIVEFCRDWEITGELEENAICYISW